MPLHKLPVHLNSPPAVTIFLHVSLLSDTLVENPILSSFFFQLPLSSHILYPPPPPLSSDFPVHLAGFTLPHLAPNITPSIVLTLSGKLALSSPFNWDCNASTRLTYTSMRLCDDRSLFVSFPFRKCHKVQGKSCSSWTENCFTSDSYISMVSFVEKLWGEFKKIGFLFWFGQFANSLRNHSVELRVKERRYGKT